MKTVSKLWRIILYPRRTSRELLEQKTPTASLVIVLGFALVLALLFLLSHLAQDYPPPPEDLQTWVETWGEFAMLPFLKIPAERYRLAQALFVVPLVLAIWILMAGSARLLSVLFGGKVTFEQYLNLFGHSFFAFWILAQLLDFTYSTLLGNFVLPALRLAYGPVIRGLVAFFPAAMWTLALGCGGLYNGLAAREAEKFPWIKAAPIGLVTFLWPMVLISTLIR